MDEKHSKSPHKSFLILILEQKNRTDFIYKLRIKHINLDTP